MFVLQTYRGRLHWQARLLLLLKMFVPQFVSHVPLQMQELRQVRQHLLPKPLVNGMTL
jgi:hypothetical protein